MGLRGHNRHRWIITCLGMITDERGKRTRLQTMRIDLLAVTCLDEVYLILCDFISVQLAAASGLGSLELWAVVKDVNIYDFIKDGVTNADAEKALDVWLIEHDTRDR